MRYQVPQFIEVEDKIFGPLTLKQFLYVGGGLALGFLIWKFIPIKFLAIIVATPVVLFFMALAFYKVNNKPFIFTIENAIQYFISNKLYIWKKEEKKIQKTIPRPEEVTQTTMNVPRLSNSKLRELTWGLDINEKIAKENSKKEMEGRLRQPQPDQEIPM